MNQHYHDMLRKQPSFQYNGHVSIMAHSLGSVIAYDILTAQSPSYAKLRGSATPLPLDKLKFKVGEIMDNNK